jgi:hypothetical protein
LVVIESRVGYPWMGNAGDVGGKMSVGNRGGMKGRREGGKEGRREGGKEGRREGGTEVEQAAPCCVI